MQFLVSRASGDEPPCDNAFSVQTEPGYSNWAVEIASLDELIEFVKTNGETILFKENEITIVDDHIC